MNTRQTPRLVAKIATSLIFGALTYWLTQLLDADLASTLLIAVFVAGVVLTVQFLVDLDARTEAREAAQRQLFERFSEDVARQVNKMNEATELFGLVEASAIRTDDVTQLVRHSTRVPATSPPVILGLVQAEIARVTTFLKEVSEGGDVTYDGEDRDWLLELAQSATRSIDATSLTTVDSTDREWIDGGLWMTDLGQRYLAAQQDAVRRGVTVRRVFLLDRPDMAEDPGFLQLARQQESAGIQVRIVDPDSIALRAGSYIDFVLFDDAVSYEATPAARISSGWRPVVISTRLVTRRPRVDERVQRFAELWQMARSLRG